MKKLVAVGFLMATVALLSLATPAEAEVSECVAQIENLQLELEGTEIGGNNPDRTRASLDSKLSGALIKIDQVKFCDAIVKLQEFEDKVLTLAVPNRKGEVKMDPADAEALAAGAAEAICCVASLDPEGTALCLEPADRCMP